MPALGVLIGQERFRVEFWIASEIGDPGRYCKERLVQQH